MRKSLIYLILILGIDYLTVAQEKQRIHVTFYGSCVCYGANADNYHGYGWQVFHNGAIDTAKYTYFNSSTGGDNTIKVEKEKRLIKKLYPTDPDIVVIGLSLGNECIRSSQDDNGREQILEQFTSRLLALADSFDTIGLGVMRFV